MNSVSVVLCGRSPKKGDGSTIIVYDLALVPAFLGRDLYCMCSGSARVWEKLCSPGESNSGLKVLPDHQATPLNYYKVGGENNRPLF